MNPRDKEQQAAAAAQRSARRRRYPNMRPALARARIEKPFRPWHDLRLGSITERYIHAAQVLFPGAAARGEERMFGVGGSC